jgi:hypothetical protein
LDVGDTGLAGLANAPRAERASPREVRVKAFMMKTCSWISLRSRGEVLENGSVCSSNLQYVRSVVVLYRRDFNQVGAEGRQLEVYKLLKAG